MSQNSFEGNGGPLSCSGLQSKWVRPAISAFSGPHSVHLSPASGPQFDDLEPTLTRHGYHLTDLVQQFDAKPTEIKALFSNQLDPPRTAALRDRMLRAGLPL